MSNLTAILILLAIVAAAIAYIINAKRKGVKCVGCSSSQVCSEKAKQGCNCATNTINEKDTH